MSDRRQQALDEARAAGRLGATRIPLALTMDTTLSDTFVGRLLIALEEGQQQRMGDLFDATSVGKSPESGK